MKMQTREIDRATKQAARGGDPRPQADLSTADIATMFGKSPQTVRDWIGNELLDAYRFQGREWRVTPENLQKFVAQQREPLKLEVVSPEPNLNAWRKAAGE
jgi:hypothetical protein